VDLSTALLVVCVCVLLLLALYLKGDVKAMLKAPFLSLSLEAKDKKRIVRLASGRAARRGPDAHLPASGDRRIGGTNDR
jgi:hypothetical protein